MGFFYGYKPKLKPEKRKKGQVRPDDMVAEDFFQEPADWWRIRGDPPDALDYDALGVYVDKQVAHMVYPKRQKKDWDFIEIAQDLQPVLERFIEMLDEEQVGDRWRGLVELPENSVGPRWQRLRSLIQAKLLSSS
ncbi:MAG: hypothetical protein ACE5NC_02545 [Anaerolineae bacterium]